jgi:Fe-S-cluster containining protein
MAMTERKRINQVAELNNQLERGTLFAHTALGENALRLNQLQAVVHGLADLLIAKGVVDSSELGQAMQRVDEELRQRGEQLGPGTLIRVETIEDQPPTATVDCESRLHICKAVCCRLNFALSVAEIEDGHARWDLGQPYHIRKQPDGCCVHQTGKGCAIYDHRPGVCRRYSCAKDPRIWSDFEGRVLNHEWIAANLGQAARPHATAVLMHRVDTQGESA